MSLAAAPAAPRDTSDAEATPRMLLPALLLAAALAARADLDGGFDVMAEALRADLRRNNDDYAEARRLSAYVDPTKSFVPKSKYVRPIHNEFGYPGLLRSLIPKNRTGDGEDKPTGKEAEGNREEPEVKETGKAEVYRRGGERKEAESEGFKRGEGEEIRWKKEEIKVEKGSLGNTLENTPDADSVGTEGKTTPRTPSRLTPRRRPPRPAQSASSGKKRYEVRTRTPADPQHQYFKNESESIEKFNSLSSTRAPATAATVKRSLATTRRTMKQFVSSVRTTGVTVMRAAEEPAPPRGVERLARGGGPGRRRTRARARGKRRGSREARKAQEERKVQKARKSRIVREALSENRYPQLRQGPAREPAPARHRGPPPRARLLHVPPGLKRLRAAMRAGAPAPLQNMPPHQLLDMAPARGPRVHARRLRNKLCDRHFLRPEGPKYDSLGRIYSEKFSPRGRGTYGFDQTRPPRLVLPRCCNCCRKSVLGCE